MSSNTSSLKRGYRHDHLATVLRSRRSPPSRDATSWSTAIRTLFLRVGVLPFFLIATLIVFALVSAQFLSVQNLVNVARQSVYLVLVSLGQMLVLITGGFDLVGRHGHRRDVGGVGDGHGRAGRGDARVHLAGHPARRLRRLRRRAAHRQP